MNINLRDSGANLWARANKWQRYVIALTIIAALFALPLLQYTFINTPSTPFVTVLFFPIGIYVLMALGLNVVVGKSGLLDLGYVAFYAVGAYAAGILTSHTGLNIWEILPIGIAAAMLSGLILGASVLRLRGDYLAIVTLGFGEIIRITALNSSSIGGSMGISNISNPPTTFGLKYDLDHPENYYWTILVLIIIVVLLIRGLSVRRPGRAWESIRQDEDVAELMGVNTYKYKLWAFVFGAAVGGAAGVLFASKAMFISPNIFTYNVSILVLAFVVFGGMGNIWGVITGAMLLAYIPERIRFISDARYLLFGLILIIMMNLRPDGMLPRKKREKIGIAKGAKSE
ncbi:MAG: branched-chain amino acid ABC transporter permease [Candidatus Planktophila sp.]